MKTHPANLQEETRSAIGKLTEELRSRSDNLSQHLVSWIQGLSKQGPPEGYFLHPHAFPTLFFPHWVKEGCGFAHDGGLHRDLTYSSISGYYFIRLIDDVMDQHPERKTNLLPLLGFFHERFQSIYCGYFPHSHPFWDYFKKQWTLSAEASVRDSHFRHIDEEAFSGVSSKKVCAGKIPMVAVCMRNGRANLPPLWDQAFDELSAFHQFHNDFFDFQRDAGLGIQTHFLFHAERHKKDGESLESWVLREGFEWGADAMKTKLARLRSIASSSQSPSFERYLEERERILVRTLEESIPGLCSMKKLLQVGL